MSERIGISLLGALAVLVVTCPAAGQTPSDELVANPTFETTDSREMPDGWSVWKPQWEQAACQVRGVDGGLLVKSERDPFGVGGATQKVKGVRGGQAYAIRAVCETENIASPFRSVLVRIGWLKGSKALTPHGMLVRGPRINGGRAVFSDVLVAPKDADGAVLSLEVKWPGEGEVLWKQVSVRPTTAPRPRKVKIGTVYLRPRNSTPQKNLELWCAQIDAAGKLGLDIVCLGEAVTRVGTTASLEDTAEPIPGPATKHFSEAARKNHIWVVVGLSERVGSIAYNTAVLFNRQGEIAGTYRKVHLPREEWKEGVRPGDRTPVFDTDFGRIAMQICYDWFFPEMAEVLALKGAEIVFAPTWGNTLPDHDGMADGETTFRVRARDNGVYMVPSVYDGNSLVIDPMGRILALNNGKEGVFWAEVDLNKRECLDWVGYWRSTGPRDRMPETYDPLAGEPLDPDANKSRDLP
ncbi:MAG: carbon-nitrogen hydrolase family protein [Sedimentisphaerales bacterium]|nr:carbon-nitrogen hydrolase family protein [Sedimentisphaerales bacterium]